jgi:hypothetical protein
MRGHFAIADHRCSLRAIKNSRTCGRAFIIYFLQKLIADARFAPEFRGSQVWSGIDFPSVYRKSFTCHSRCSVDLRLHYECLIVRELPLKMF